jgi:WD40 repeat protein
VTSSDTFALLVWGFNLFLVAIINLNNNTMATAYDFSGLTIWQTYLQGANLHDCSLVGADIHKSVFSQAIANTLCVEFSPDGKLLATSDANGRVYLWNIERQTIEMRHVLSLKAHAASLHILRFLSAYSFGEPEG